ncbi:MAG: hypothetical protein JWM06_2274 [Actinomycetia bacterium]|nr:hypothetical protein [Actinomycetes bacterium]
MGVYEQGTRQNDRLPPIAGLQADVQGAPPVELNDMESSSVNFHSEPEEKQRDVAPEDAAEEVNFHPEPEEKAQPQSRSRLPGAAGFAPGSGAFAQPQDLAYRDDRLGDTARAEAKRAALAASRGVDATDKAAAKTLKWKKLLGYGKKALKFLAGGAVSKIPVVGDAAGGAVNLFTSLKAAASTDRHRYGLEELKKQMTEGKNGVPKATMDDLALIEYAIAQKEKKGGRVLRSAVPVVGTLSAMGRAFHADTKKEMGTKGVERTSKAVELVARAQLPGAAGMWAQAIIFELVDGDQSLFDAVRNAIPPLLGAELIAKKLASS